MSSSVLLSPKDIETLKELRGLLTYFAHATTLLEAENQPTSSLAIPTIVGLKKALYKAETHHTTSIKTGLQCAIQSQLSGFLSDDHSLSYWLLWINDVNWNGLIVLTSEHERSVHSLISASMWSRLYCIVYYRCSGLWWNSAITRLQCYNKTRVVNFDMSVKLCLIAI